VVRLRKVYRDVAAVDGLDFKLAAGAVTALLGGNGAGKTTTIAMLMGLVIPTSGQARVFGADMARERYRVLYRMNFESPYVDVPMRLTVRQNLEVYGRLYGVRHLKSQVAAIAADLRLSEFLDRPYGKLSAGQKTRVSLAKALLNEPELLLLDEPTASLDLGFQFEIAALLSRLNRDRGTTMVVSTHDLNLAATLCTELVLLKAGRVIVQGPTDAVLTPAHVRDLYGVIADVTTHPRAGHLTVVPLGRAE
jgi:ABC-2 type transport system ATP-binding protein